MASSTDYSNKGQPRKVPHSLTTSFFGKSKKSGEPTKSPIQQSPTVGFRPSSRGGQLDDASARPSHHPDPLPIPEHSYDLAKNKKLAPHHTFNSHYRSISRSMNDLGSIFSRGRSPPQREPSPARPGTGKSVHAESFKAPDSPHSRHFEIPSVPVISVGQHYETTTRTDSAYEGWLNVIDSTSKKTPGVEAWKLYHAVISEGHLMLHKPPTGVQIRAFSIETSPQSIPRPQSAPATAPQPSNGSSLHHKSTTRHPDLQIDADGSVVGGTVEALCHELVFTKDPSFLIWGTRLLSAWTSPETALSILQELSTLQDVSDRIAEIIERICMDTPGLLLDSSVYNCARLLVEKGIGGKSPEHARRARSNLESTMHQLGKKTVFSEWKEADAVTTLGREDILEISPIEFAHQVYLYHRQYLESWSPLDDFSLLLQSPHLPPTTHRNPLAFNSNHLHFLTERVLMHILSGDEAIPLERRAVLITHWINICLAMYQIGDMAGYVSVMFALTSPAILRLKTSWTLVAAELRAFVSEHGVQVMRILERRRLHQPGEHGSAPQIVTPDTDVEDAFCVPYFGDLLLCMDEAVSGRTRIIDYRRTVEGAVEVKEAMDRWIEPISSSQHSQPPMAIQIDTHLQACLYQMNQSNQSPGAVYDAQWFEKSVLLEPLDTGLYLQSHYHQKLPLSTGANIPLLFTDVQKSFSLFDRQETLAIAGNLHKKTPSTGYSAGQSNLSSTAQPSIHVRPPSSSGLNPSLRRTRSFPPSGQTTGYDGLDSTTRERSAVLHGADDAMLRAIRDVAGVNQRLFHSKDGELVLKSLIDESQSRPASIVIETTSPRASTAAKRISGSLGAARSPFNSENLESTSRSDNKCYSVVPKGGTLERLVDILVLGVEDFSKRMIRVGRDGNPDHQVLLKMDMDVFMVTFFATFRSFCSPGVLIEYLKKRLLGAKTAAAASKVTSDDDVFPDWTGVEHNDHDTVDWKLVAKIHIGVLEAVSIWLTEFYVDFYSDQYLGEAFTTFLQHASGEIEVWSDLASKMPDLSSDAQCIKGLWEHVNETFGRLVFRPCWYDEPVRGTPAGHIELPRAADTEGIVSLVDSLNARYRGLFDQLKLVDWMLAFEVLETQSAEVLGFFPNKSTHASHEDDEPIQNIFTLLSQLKRRPSGSTVLEALSPLLREMFALHFELSRWILGQIVDSRITVQKRADRLVALLKALSLSRERMSGMALYDTSDDDGYRQTPSFVGNTIAYALVRPESRLFNYAWQLAIKRIHGTVSHYETLEQLVPRWDVEDVDVGPQLAPCVGWMLERLLEIVCHVPNMVVENNRLINFDKRRYVYNFINNFTGQTIGSNPAHIHSIPAIDVPEFRRIRESSSKENQTSRQPKIKLFSRLLHQEQEKQKRDAKQKELLERQQKMQLRAEIRRQQPAAVRNELSERKGNKRLGVNTILKHVRPISMALTGQWPPPQQSPRVVTPGDLPSLRSLDPTRKPALAIELKRCRTVEVPKDVRERFCWRIVNDGGSALVLQAPTEIELDEWLQAIETVRGKRASEVSDVMDILTNFTTSQRSRKTFGVPLEELCLRDDVKIPVVVESLLNQIEARGMSEVGLYRIGGSLASVNALKAAIDAGAYIDFDDDRWYDINVVSGTFKAFMRELPVKPIDAMSLENLRRIAVTVHDDDQKVPLFRDVMANLPPHHYHFLRRVYNHFHQVQRNAGVNKMGAVNLAIVFGPGMCPDTSIGISPDLGIYQNVVKVLISNAEAIFPEREFTALEEATDSSSVEVSIHGTQSSSETLVSGSLHAPVEVVLPTSLGLQKSL